MSDESEASTSQQAIKRSMLEINEADKYKSFMLKQLETKKFKPSDALDRVKQFLPDFKAANEKLLTEAKENPSQVDIENCENDEQVIEMNLAFVPEGDSDSDSDDDEEAGEEENEENGDEAVKDSIQKLLQMNEKKLAKNKPMIKVIEGEIESDDEDEDDDEDFEGDEIDEEDSGDEEDVGEDEEQEESNQNDDE